MLTDSQLLRQFVLNRSEPAFAALVQRHLDRIYALALRQVGGDTHLAQDICQTVFSTLARKAPALIHHSVLGGWLYRTTQYTAIDLVRSEQRRRRREQEAQVMDESFVSTPDPDWNALRPLLERTIAELSASDRDSVWMRFFEDRSFSEIGRLCGLSENAARMRVERALAKLHAALARQGVTSTHAALGIALAHIPVAAAPGGLASAVTSGALVAVQGAAGAMGALTSIMTLIKSSLIIGGAAAAAAVFIAVRSPEEPSTSETVAVVSPTPAVITGSDSADVLDTPLVEPSPAPNPNTTRLVAPTTMQPAAANPANADRMPVPRVQPAPVFPPSLTGLTDPGIVDIGFIVDSNGNVRDAYAISSTQSELEAAAIEAVRNWAFDSGLKGGRSVNTRMHVEFVFHPALPHAVVGPTEPRSL